VEEITAAIKSVHQNYYSWEWSWASGLLTQFYGKPVNRFTPGDVIAVTEKWLNSVLEIDRLLYQDAQKEFSMVKQTGFGIDGDRVIRQLDFDEVRGEFETHAEVSSIRDHMDRKTALGKQIIDAMNLL
jgi:hypothetical protein